MQTLTIPKGFEVFESTFEQLERDWKHSNANDNHSKGIRSIRMQILTIKTKLKAFERDSKHSNANSKYSKGIQRIQIQIRTIRIQILTI